VAQDRWLNANDGRRRLTSVHVCRHPRLTLPSWEGRKFFCECGRVFVFVGGEFLELPEDFNDNLHEGYG